MRNKNKTSKLAFVLFTAYWSLIGMIVYKNTLFKTIGSFSLSESRIILWAMMIVGVALGTYITYKRRRNDLSILVNITLPFGAYFVISYWSYIRGWIILVLFVALCLSAGYIYVMMRSTDRIAGGVKLSPRRVWNSFLGTRTIVSCCVLSLAVPLAVSVLFGNSLIHSSVASEKNSNTDEWTVANQMDTVLNLQDSVWADLPISEKVNTLQTIANIESNYLGLPHELNVVVKPLGESIVASYDDRTHSISINVGYLDEYSSYETLDSLCHEAYHAYQHRLCEAYDSVDASYRNLKPFEYVTDFKAEFADYVDGSKDYVAYRYQLCESTAREYAREAVIDYRSIIDDYIDNEDE